MASTTSGPKPLPKPAMDNLVHLLAFGLGAGCSPKAPGTMGTLLAVGLYLPLSRLPLSAYLAVLVVVVVAGVWICDKASRDLGVHDHPGIVWDEIAAFLALALVLPSGWVWLAAGFVVFRFFDIFKPWPIRDLDHRLGGGLGIMLDDLAAAVYSAVTLRLIEYLATHI